jgi:hypothetical protein
LPQVNGGKAEAIALNHAAKGTHGHQHIHIVFPGLNINQLKA